MLAQRAQPKESEEAYRYAKRGDLLVGDGNLDGAIGEYNKALRLADQDQVVDRLPALAHEPFGEGVVLRQLDHRPAIVLFATKDEPAIITSLCGWPDVKQIPQQLLVFLRVFVLSAPWVSVCGAEAPLSTDEAAALVLSSANRGFNEQKYDFAAERFREFLKLYAGHKDAAQANYGLGLVLLEAPKKDYEGAIPPLQAAASRGDFADRALALYYLGAARRALGEQALERAVTKPAEADQHRAAAAQRFTEASASFGEAAAAFLARAGATLPATNWLADLGWTARARCDVCDMLLRLNRFKEAAEVAEAFRNDPAVSAGSYRDLALYHLGYARFSLKDYDAAARAVSQLAPFQQDFGLHARYLLARTLHLGEERVKAAAQYRAVLADYEQRKKTAQQAMQNPAALTPEKRASCEVLLRDPPPEYFSRISFYLALIACETGRFPEALDGFAAFIPQYPKSPLLPEAQLRLAFCRMQTASYADAVKDLQLLSAQPALADRALWWLARCQLKAADPNNATAYAQAAKTALDNLRRATELAGQLAPKDPDAKRRRGEILLDLADVSLAAAQYKEAADFYQRVVQENSNPNRAEEALQRRVTALHLAGLYREADDLGALFEQTYPRSVLLPAVWFRRAENAYLTATAAANNPALPNRDQELPRLFGEAIVRYQRLIERYPEFAGVNLAREALGACYYRLGKHRDAVAVLGAIPEDERRDALANTPYLLGDCTIRLLPAVATDAVGASGLLAGAEQAAKLLESFAVNQDKNPALPDALLKLGWCHERIAEAVSNADERKKALGSALAAYDRFLKTSAQDPSAPVAIFGRAQCLVGLGDLNGGLAELGRFAQDPLRQSTVAAPAMLRFSTLLRGQNRAADAASALQQFRAQQETILLKDPARADAVASL